jgi:hypothetical protein
VASRPKKSVESMLCFVGLFLVDNSSAHNDIQAVTGQPTSQICTLILKFVECSVIVI